MSSLRAPEVSVMVPLYNEEGSVVELLDRIEAAMSRLGRPYEVILVDDGSSDRTAALLRDAVETRPFLRAVLLRLNSGQTAALAAAIDHSRGDILIPLDGDLQNDPADIPILLDKLAQGFDVVSGWRKSRKDPFLTRTLPSKIANGLISLISGVKLHDYGCTLKAYRREVLKPVVLVGEMHRFIPILASWQGARVTEVAVNHHPRLSGKSKYGLTRTFKVVLDLLTIKFMGSFLTKPIYAFGGTGAGLGALSFLLALYTLWEKLVDGVWVHRNPVFILAIFFALAGLQLIMMGLLGEILTRIYFASSHTTPYVVREVIESPMCGIAGFRLTEPADAARLAAMTAALTHRGPDGMGYFAERGVGLGHRRLSILDLSTGAQPQSSEDGSVVVVFNGEIYNFLELRSELEARGHRFSTRSDTEVLVHLYEDLGDAFPARLNGIFAFALYDRKRDRLLLARDPMGVKPLYYALVPGGLLFGSELKALRAHPSCPTQVDEEALRAYLVCEYVPAPLTILKGVRKLLPGHLLMASGHKVEVKRYWTLPLPVPIPERREEAADLLRHEILRSVRGQLMSDVPLGVFLSGGVDSSIVAAAMTACGGRVESFSVGFENPSFDESAFARQAARHLGCEHHEHMFSESDLLGEIPRVLAGLDEPFADPSVFPTALLSRFARERVTVALGGDGGDELFAGYPTYRAHASYGYYARMPRWLRRFALAAADAVLPVSHANLPFGYQLRKFRDGAECPMPMRHHLWLGAWTPERLATLMPGASGPVAVPWDWITAPPSTDPVTQAQWLDLHTYLVEDILAKVDRASMMASLEVRVPLLDTGVASLAFSLPVAWRLSGRRGKVLLKEAFAQDLPPGFFDRPKKGFGIPLAAWLCGPLRPFAEELLSDAVLGSIPFFDPKVPRRLWGEHLARKADHRKPLWSLLCFLDWWRRETACR